MVLQWRSAISNSHGTSEKVGDSGKFKIFVFYKAFGEPNTVFTSVLISIYNFQTKFLSMRLLTFKCLK